VILAAGEGKRMRSGRPKILHLLGGQPLVRYPIALVQAAGIAGSVVVVAPGADAVRTALADLGHLLERPHLREIAVVGGGEAPAVRRDADRGRPDREIDELTARGRRG
jgi:bifunctional N-acetylglucosamine-1-phosphate-uridyltransferase/glucosamine-1-phosphate-acetyltransferase GlmU-like protein